MMGDNNIIGFFNEDSGEYIKDKSGQGKVYVNFNAFKNKTNEVCYISELSDTQYKFADFLKIAKGNEKLATIIFEMVEWQTPETIFDELANSGEVDEKGKFLIWTDGNI